MSKMTYMTASIVSAALLLAPGECGAAVLTLRESIETESDTVRLSDIVLEDLAGIEDVVLIDSPPWGSKKNLSRNFVASRLRNRDVEIHGPIGVIVTRKMLEKSAEIQSALGEKLRGMFAQSRWNETGGKLELEFRNFPASLPVPPGEVTIECELPANISSYQVVSFTVTTGSGFNRRFSTGCLFHLMADCAVATRDIGRRETVAEADIEWAEMDMASCYGMPVTEKTDILGMRVDRYVKKGSVISLDAVERIPEVMKGEAVILQVSKGLMVVSAWGVSLEDGYRGDMILVRNSASGKIDKYEVVDKGKVSPLSAGSREGR